MWMVFVRRSKSFKSVFSSTTCLTLRVPGNLRLAISFYDVPLGKWTCVHNDCTAQSNPNRVCQPCGVGC